MGKCNPRMGEASRAHRAECDKVPLGYGAHNETRRGERVRSPQNMSFIDLKSLNIGQYSVFEQIV